MMIERLARQFNVKGVSFNKQDSLAMIEINNRFASAKISLHGACVLSFTPRNKKDILWLSSAAVYDGRSPIRGGVPICWPWFGGHPVDSSLPAHGFVRNMAWELTQISELDSGETQLELSLNSTTKTLAIWPYEFNLQLKIKVGEKLVCSLTTTNLSHKSLEITEAFHAYFNVEEAKGLFIEGLENATHLDKLTHADAVQQVGKIVLNPPMDSVYLKHTSVVKIKDKINNRTLVVEKSDANSCVVWNPGLDIVKGFKDIPDEDWTKFVCVEPGNVLDDSITIAKGSKHTMTMVISCLQ